MRAIRNGIVLYGAGAIGLLALLLLYYLSDPEAGLFPACPFYSLTGWYCTGCGSQRALHDLLHLDLMGSISHNALFVPAIGLLLSHVGSRTAKALGGPSWKSPLDARRAPLILLLVVVLFTACRNIPLAPFHLLAP